MNGRDPKVFAGEFMAVSGNVATSHGSVTSATSGFPTPARTPSPSTFSHSMRVNTALDAVGWTLKAQRRSGLTRLHLRRIQSHVTVEPTRAIGIPPPLKGVRILDLTRVLAGPTATMLLADLGADVIKVEEVSRGDDTRAWIPPHAPITSSAPSEASHLPPESAYFMAVNRNKRSMAVNFKTPAGLKIVKRLVEKADVLVENFVPGKLAEMGLGWDDCRALNNRLVYASISGELHGSCR